MTLTVLDDDGSTDSASTVISVTGGGGGDPVTVVLQNGLDGYTGTRDTYIVNYDKDRNFGGMTTMRTYHDGKYRALVAFDLSSIPAGATIQSAKLKLYCTAYSYPRDTYALSAHRVTRSWTEGTAYYKVHEMDGATWNEYVYTDDMTTTAGNWTSPGGDCESTAAASITSGLAANKWLEWDLTTLAGGWVSGSVANNGVLIRSHVGAGVSLVYNSSEHATASLRPKLEVTYTTE